jgi:hypothetical protein
VDFLDPVKVRRHARMLFLGYALIGLAIVATALILLYQSSGFGITKDGEVIQNGLVFTASTPDGAQIFIDGQKSNSVTNKRLVLVAGQYVFQFTKEGYTSWTHSLQVYGGSVNRLDYAFLFPTKLETLQLRSLEKAPQFTSQSPDRRWLLVALADKTNTFLVYDLKGIQKEPLQFNLPGGVATAGDKHSWQVVEWSDDNVHLLIKHTVDGKAEFLLLNRENGAESLNLTQRLKLTADEVRLHDLKYDQYYLYTAKSALLQTANLSQTAPLTYLDHVLAYKPYGKDRMLYVTDDIKKTDPKDKNLGVMLADGDQTYTIRKITAGDRYLLDMASYNGKLYIAAGVDSENKVIVYRNPIDQISDPSLGVAVPVATLRVTKPNTLSFSDNARYVVAENANRFGVYDAEIDRTFNYKQSQKLDSAAKKAVWMDGNRLLYPSEGTLLVFDADQTNRQKLMPVTPGYEPAFTPDYKQVITIAPDAKGVLQLQRTWLRNTVDR